MTLAVVGPVEDVWGVLPVVAMEPLEEVERDVRGRD